MPCLSDAESVNQCQQGLMCRKLLLHFQTCTNVGSLKMSHVKGVSGAIFLSHVTFCLTPHCMLTVTYIQYMP